MEKHARVILMLQQLTGEFVLLGTKVQNTRMKHYSRKEAEAELYMLIWII